MLESLEKISSNSILKYKTEILIASEIYGKNVTGIGCAAFYGCSSITRI